MEEQRTQSEAEQLMGQEMKRSDHCRHPLSLRQPELGSDLDRCEGCGMLFDRVVPSSDPIITNDDPGYNWSQFKLLRRMRDVKRLAGFFTTRAYDDATHCYYTGLLFAQMADAHDLSYSPGQLLWVLCHDAVEVLTGDLLYPAKNTNWITKEAWDDIEKAVTKEEPLLQPFTNAEGMAILGPTLWDLFKDCDALELWLCMTEERNRHNEVANPDGGTVEARMFAVLRESKFVRIREAVGA